MKRYLILVCLASAIAGGNAVAANSFPWWFHTRPKPVLLDDEPPVSSAATRNRALNRGTAVYTDSRRFNVHDVYNSQVHQTQPSKSWLTEFFMHGWRSDTPRSK